MKTEIMNPSNVTTNKKIFDISFVLLIISIAFGMYFCQNIVIFEADPRRYLDISEYIPLFLLTLIPSIIYFIYKRKSDESLTKFDVVTLSVFACLFFVNLVTVLCLPNGEVFLRFPFNQDSSIIIEKTFDFSFSVKLFSILYCFMSLLTAYLMICELPKRFRTESHIRFWYIVCLIILGCFMICSYIFDFQEYVRVFSNITDAEPITTSFMHRCNYAVFMSYMVFALLYLNIKKPHWIYYALSIFLVVNIALTQSKINLFMSVLLIGAYALFRFFYTYKENKKRNLITLFVVLGTLILAILVFILSIFVNLGIVSTISLKLLDIANSFYMTTWSRGLIWQNVGHIYETFGWVTGVGFSIFNLILGAYQNIPGGIDTDTDLPHNAFMQLIGEGGIPLLVVFLALLGVLVFVLIKLRKKYPNQVFITAAFSILYIVHMVFDANTPVFISCTPIIDSLFVAFIMFIPVFSLCYHDTHKDNERLVLQAKNQEVNKSSNLIVVKTILLILTAIIPTTLFIIFDSSNYDNVLLLVILTLLSLLLIYIICIIPYDKKKINSEDAMNKLFFPSMWLFVAQLGGSIILSLILKGTSNIYYCYFAFLNFFLYGFMLFSFKAFEVIKEPLSIVLNKLNNFVIKYEAKDIEKNKY